MAAQIAPGMTGLDLVRKVAPGSVLATLLSEQRLRLIQVTDYSVRRRSEAWAAILWPEVHRIRFDTRFVVKVCIMSRRRKGIEISAGWWSRDLFSGNTNDFLPTTCHEWRAIFRALRSPRKGRAKAEGYYFDFGNRTVHSAKEDGFRMSFDEFLLAISLMRLCEGRSTSF